MAASLVICLGTCVFTFLVWCVFSCLLCFLCVAFVYVCGQCVGNQAKEVVCICVTKSQAEQFMRVGLIELWVATLLQCFLRAFVRLFGQ